MNEVKLLNGKIFEYDIIVKLADAFKGYETGIVWRIALHEYEVETTWYRHSPPDDFRENENPNHPPNEHIRIAPIGADVCDTLNSSLAYVKLVDMQTKLDNVKARHNKELQDIKQAYIDIVTDAVVSEA